MTQTDGASGRGSAPPAVSVPAWTRSAAVDDERAWPCKHPSMLTRLGPILAVCALSAPVRNSVPEPQPVTVVREFYEKDSIRAYEFYSARLKDLFVKDDEAAGGDLGNLTFAFHVNGQDVEDGWEKRLRFDLVESDGAHAVVRVTFRNFEPQDIRYTLVRERGRWLIDDVRAVAADRWVLSDILAPAR